MPVFWCGRDDHFRGTYWLNDQACPKSTFTERWYLSIRTQLDRMNSKIVMWKMSHFVTSRFSTLFGYHRQEIPGFNYPIFSVLIHVLILTCVSIVCWVCMRRTQNGRYSNKYWHNGIEKCTPLKRVWASRHKIHVERGWKPNLNGLLISG